MDVRSFLYKHGSDILTGFSLIGLVGVAVSTAVGTNKALKRVEKSDTKVDILKKTWTCYLPAAGFVVGTASCIIGANLLNQKKQGQLTAAYALLQQSFNQYREGLIDLHGLEADQEVRDYVVGKYANYHRLHDDEPDEKLTWYDPLSQTIFRAYEKEVIDAEYHFNRNWALSGGCADVNDYFSFLGINWKPEWDGKGWWMEEGLQWVDFEHRLTKLPSGKEVYAIWPVFQPSEYPYEYQ